IQMTWKGIVSHDGHATMATTQPAARAPQPTSRGLGDRKPVAGVAHGLDRPRGPELLAQPPHADVDDVRPRVEPVAPHLRQETLPADHLADVEDEVVEEAELTVGEVDRKALGDGLAARDVQLELADPDRRGLDVAPAPEVDAHARDELFEGERLCQVVVCAELE